MDVDAYLTSGEVAAILGVTRATVVHWINSGKLKSDKTKGGHNRVAREALRGLLPEVFDARGMGTSVDQYCWEYFNAEGDPSHKCKKCLVYRVRAAFCYQLVEDVGHKGINCDSVCENCAFHKLSSEKQ